MKKVKVIKGEVERIRRDKSNEYQRLRVGVYVRVSTDSEEQLSSYNSQVAHYKEYVRSNPEWELVKIYADEAISGTQATKRTDFQHMITEAVDGKLDLVITKSISRFARNTLDTLKYVRLLKEHKVAIFFEKENINTLDMNGEMLLVILSSLAQQESESISANVKMGLKMKMKRGELVGFHGCLGYDYDLNCKTISVNEKEAEIIRFIFSKYLEGNGCYIIAKELSMLGYKTKRGNPRWHEGSVRRILRNEKYKGDIVLGKTFTVDPLSHRRVENFGEEDKYYIANHHEPIVSEEDFDEVQEIMDKRGRQKHIKFGDIREVQTRKYAFSKMMRCDFCGGTISRRSWHAGTSHRKTVWACSTSTKKGKKYCPNSKGIKEEVIEAGFVDAFDLLCTNHKKIVTDYIISMGKSYSKDNVIVESERIHSAIRKVEAKINKLIDMNLDSLVDEEVYTQRQRREAKKLDKLKEELYEVEQADERKKAMKERLSVFKKIIDTQKPFEKFERYIFEELVDHVIIGRTEEDGVVNPYVITFVFKTGSEVANSGAMRDESLYSQSLPDTCGDGLFAETYIE